MPRAYAMLRRTAWVLLALSGAGCTPVTPHYGGPAAPDAPAPARRAPRAESPTGAVSVRPALAEPSAPADLPGPPPGSGSAPFRFAFQLGDELAISVWKEKDLETTQRIQRDGTISPMLLGTVPVVDRTVDEVRAELERRYTEYLREPKVSVRVVSVHSERVFVLGEVRQPAAITLNGPTSIVQALAQAGGFNQDVADQKRVRLIRTGADGKPMLINVNMAAMLTGRQALTQVLPGDVVYVPPTGLADWSRGLTQALGPVTNIIGTAGSIVTSYAAIKALDNSSSNGN